MNQNVDYDGTLDKPSFETYHLNDIAVRGHLHSFINETKYNINSD